MAARHDLVIRSQQILTPAGWRAGEIAVRDGTIVALRSIVEPPDAERTIDVGDHPVIPGLIDTHVHFRDPGYTYKEDFESGTRAAAAGGVTTVFDMPNVDPPTTTAERLRAHLDNAARKSLVDFGHNASAAVPDTIGELAEAGATAFKIWMQTDIGRDYPHGPGTALSDHADLYRVFEEVTETGLPLYVHPHDQSLYQLFVARAQEQWGMDFRSYARARRSGSGVVINSGIATAIELQRSTGCRLHVLHVSTRAGIDMIRAAKDAGRAVTAEVNPAALFVTNSWQTIEEKGPFVLGGWVPEAEAAATWEAVLDGTIDVLATDHGPHTKEEKEIGWTNMYAAPGGSPCIEHYIRLLLTAVNDGRIGLERVVELCCRNPAVLTGYDRTKGSIAVGADADLVVLDMGQEDVLTASNSHYRCGWMPYEGFVTKGAPIMTILRGDVIMDHGRVLAQPGNGKLLTPAGAGRAPVTSAVAS